MTHFVNTTLKSSKYGKFCFPYQYQNREAVSNELFSVDNTVKRVFGDFIITFDYITIGVVCCILISFAIWKMLA